MEKSPTSLVDGPQSPSGRNGETKSLDLPGLELRPLSPPAHYQLLDRLRHRGLFAFVCTNIQGKLKGNI
jgi:hypothetical protein